MDNNYKSASSRITFSPCRTPTKTPISRKIYSIKEIVRDTPNNTAIFRHLRYEEISTNSEPVFTPLKTFRKQSFSEDSALIDGLANISLKLKETSQNKEVPMDIDSSGKLSPNSSGEFEQCSTAEVSFRQRKYKPEKAETFNKTEAKTERFQCPKQQFSYLYVVLLILVVVSVYFLTVSSNYFTVINRDAQLDFIKRDLNAVAYQTSAVNIIIKTFEHIHTWAKPVKILPFVGTTGVGKTFTANILKRNFVSSLVYEMNSQNLGNTEKQKDIFENLRTFCTNLIIIEDLSVVDLSKVMDFIAALPEKLSVLVIPIFNIHSTLDGWKYEVCNEDYDLVRDTFDTSGSYHELVFFNMVEVAMLEEWLHQELRKRNIEEHRHVQLMRSLIDADQVQRKGFKGINTKLLLALDNVR